MDKIVTAVNNSPIIPIYKEHTCTKCWRAQTLNATGQNQTCLREGNVEGLRYRCLRDIKHYHAHRQDIFSLYPCIQFTEDLNVWCWLKSITKVDFCRCHSKWEQKRWPDGRLVYNRQNSTQNCGSSINFSKAKNRRHYDKNTVLINGHITGNKKKIILRLYS